MTCHWKIVFVYLNVMLAIRCEVLGSISKICPNKKKPLSYVRKKRYLTFPDGSNAAITISGAKTFLTHVPSGWFMTTDMDVAFPLPNGEFTVAHARRKLHHKQKKDLWERFHKALELNNMNGHACILRSICEAKFHLAAPGKSLIHDILKAIFTVPEFEEEFKNEIKGTYDEVLDPGVCDKIHECPFSIIQNILSLNKPKHSL